MRKLLDDGASVAVIDNLLTGHEGNLAEVRDRIDFHRVDIRDSKPLSALMRGADPKALAHEMVVAGRRARQQWI